MILAIKTDSPSVVLSVLSMNGIQKNAKTWEAGRELSQQILAAISDICNPSEIKGIIIFEGPGSYTGLRIGFSVANALGYSQNIPVITSNGSEWISDGMAKLNNEPELNISSFSPAAPYYGGSVYTTKPKK